MQPQNLIIRKIEERDNPIVANIIRTSLEEFGCNQPGTAWADPATDAVFQQFTEANTIYFVAEIAGKVVGGCGINTLAGEPDKCELQKLYLNRDYRGHGIATILLDKCLAFATAAGYASVYLETKKELKVAVPLYEKRGFEYIDQHLGNTGHFNCEIKMLKKL